MPAAAVIPALKAYTKVVAVKKLVVEFRRKKGRRMCNAFCTAVFLSFRESIFWHSVVGI